jgi:hypothetical protein
MTADKNKDPGQAVKTNKAKRACYYRASRQERSPGLEPGFSFREILGRKKFCYDIINVSSAVLDEDALLTFDTDEEIMTPDMVKTAQDVNMAEVFLSVGGENGNFNYLDSPWKPANFFDTLKKLYRDWGVNGINFDICRIDETHCPYIIEGIQWFKRRCPGAAISLTTRAADVCPAMKIMDATWNILVPVINELKEIIDRLQIMAFDYKYLYSGLEGAPTDNPQGMLEYIFSSYVEEFDINEDCRYEGFPAARIFLGVPAAGDESPGFFTPPAEVNKAIEALDKKYPGGIGGILVCDLDEDARGNFTFSSGINL